MMQIIVRDFDNAIFSNPKNIPLSDTSNCQYIAFDQFSDALDTVLTKLAEEMGPISKNYYNGVNLDPASKTYAKGTGSGTKSLEHYVRLIPVNDQGEYIESSEPHHLGGILIYNDEHSVEIVLEHLQQLLQENQIEFELTLARSSVHKGF